MLSSCLTLKATRIVVLEEMTPIREIVDLRRNRQTISANVLLLILSTAHCTAEFTTARPRSFSNPPEQSDTPEKCSSSLRLHPFRLTQRRRTEICGETSTSTG